MCIRGRKLFISSHWVMTVEPGDICAAILCWDGVSFLQPAYKADSRFAPRQWEMALLCNDISHWLGANLESALSLWIHNTDYLVQDCSNSHSNTLELL